ncbi:acetate--CoA ligase [Candidatus Babeliales bacterium]|nr:acetate--CoA ligase [Candidatus Babeliales bacterium]MCF7899166.1 acetate--CoA ligase [Candidatus Babeliales bacterium]
MINMQQNLDLTELEKFWDLQAKNIPWFKKWSKVLDWNLPYAKWFVNGTTNASYACLDQHMKTDIKNKVAIYWQNESGQSEIWTYEKLFIQTNKFAYALKKIGLKKGDRVILYLPMIPQAIVAMLAVARLGAIHSVVFSGFSSQALKDRIIDCQAKFIITADYTVRRGKFIDLKSSVDNALQDNTINFVKNTIIIKRPNNNNNNNLDNNNILLKKDFDLLYHELIQNTPDYIEPEEVESNHPLFILYTSGTTGKPKGVMHGTGGYLTYVNSTFNWAFKIEKDSVYWCTADIGWITGHSYVVYAPLISGISSVLFEGAPDYPTHEIWWQIIEKYKVSIIYTSPTAIRLLMKFGQDFHKKYNLSSLKNLGSVGEPLNPTTWEWFNTYVGNKKCPIIDTWWQTETGGFMISPAAGLNLIDLKPGSTTFPLPMIEADIVDNSGDSVKPETRGFLVIKKPWPGLTIGLYNDKEERFKETYWSKFKNYYYSGDYAIKDKDGYFWMLGRADEVLNIAGHRIGTAEIENAIIHNKKVAQSAAIGIPDDITGQAIVAFVELKKDILTTQENKNAIKEEIIENIKKQIGSFAKPKEILFVDNLPKTRSGKIMRRVLSALAQNKNIGDISTLEDFDLSSSLFNSDNRP